jgi:hypothetical protein
MSFDQLSFDDKIGVNVDSFSSQSALQRMSRRCIMALSVKASRDIGMTFSGLFCTASACVSLESYPSHQLITLTLLSSPLGCPRGPV